MAVASPTLRAFAWSAADQFGQKGIRFAISIVLARLLTPAEYGLMAMLLVFLFFAQCFTDAGLSAGLIQRKEITPDDETSVFYLNVAAAVVLAGALCLISPLVARFYGQAVLAPMLCLSALGLVVSSLGIVQTALLTRHVDFATQARVGLVTVMVSGSVGVGMACYGWGAWSLVGQYLCQALASTSLLCAWGGWRPAGRFRWGCIRSLWPFSSRLLASGVLNTVSDNLYTLVIGRLYQPAELGFYWRASTLAMLPAFSVAGATQRVVFPLFSRMQGETEQLRQGLRRILRVITALHFPVMAGLAVVAEPLVRCLLTEKWLPCVPYFRILCLVGMLYPLHALHLNVLTAQGRSDLFFRLEVVKKVLAVGLLVATFRWGVGAMVAGILAHSVICLAINGFYTRQLIGYCWRQQFGDLAPVVAVTLTMALLVSGVAHMGSMRAWMLLAIQAAVGSATYGTMVLCLRKQGYSELWDLVARVWGRLNSGSVA